jgi:phosphoribosylanthranilate isomerase
MTKIKVCGVRSYDNALMIAEAGADMIGLNFYTKTPRYIEPNDAREIAVKLRKTLGEQCPILIGLFVNATDSHISEVMDIVGLDFVQLSGDESNSILRELRGVGFKSIRPTNKAMALDDVKYFESTFPTKEQVPSLIVDAFNPKLYGGTGETASIEVALAVKELVPRMMLAGGLNPDNVAERAQAIHPWGVDVASGVEDGTPGLKDEAKVKAFIEAVKGGSA